MQKYLLISLIIIISKGTGQAQDYTDSTYLELTPILSRKTLSVAGVSALYTGTIVDSYVTWWKDSRNNFSFMEGEWFDRDGDNGIDKLGHFFTSYAFYKIQRDLFLWGDFSPGEAQLLSGSLTFLMALIIEVGDGFSRYGFDYKDFVFNVGGLTYAVLQEEFPFLNNINFKWSYFPSDGFSFPPKFSNHYDGHIYWMTFNLFNMVSGKSEYTGYIQPAVGFSISSDLKPEYIFGLDINLLPLFKSNNNLVSYLGTLVNLFHLPSPGSKYSENNNPEYRMFLLR
jgi:hypothetical protein